MKRYGASWKLRAPTKLSRMSLPASSTWSKSAEAGTSTLRSGCTDDCAPVCRLAQPLQHITLHHTRYTGAYRAAPASSARVLRHGRALVVIAVGKQRAVTAEIVLVHGSSDSWASAGDWSGDTIQCQRRT